MYLNHLLLENRCLCVHDMRTGAFSYMGEEIAREYIAKGLIKPIGTRRKILDLHWLGTPWTPIAAPADATDYRPSEARPTKYAHNRETEDNPRNNWTLKHLPFTRSIYAAVHIDCIQPFRP